MLKSLLLTVAILVVGYFVYTRFTSGQNALLSPGLTAELRNIMPEPSPTPFYEVTIPALRERTFSSQLGELRRLATNNNYTSYLTSYNSDGLKINGLLTEPKGVMPTGGWPAIVFIHGYIPPTLYQTTEKYVAYVDYLAKQGFVVFKIDLRGHGDSEGEAGGAYYSSDYVIDALNARAALRSSDLVHPDKIGFWGHSMAGNVTFRTIASAEDIPAVVIWAGAVYTYEDFMEYGISDNSYRPPGTDSPGRRKRQALMDTYGAFNKDSEFWRQIVATNYLDGVTTAIEVHHAQNDEVVPIDYSRNLMSVLDRTSLPHELYEYESGGHNIDGASFNLAMHRTAEFFAKYLK